MQLNVKEGAKAEELGTEAVRLKDLGCKLMYFSFKWADIEPKPGEYKLDDIATGLYWMEVLGFETAVTIQTIDTNNKVLPPDLMTKAFDSKEVRDRFDALLAKIAEKLKPSTKWVMLGNEVDAYLSINKAELEPYAKFFEHGRSSLRTIRPNQLVGITTTFDGLRDRPEVFIRLNRESDIVTMTYYPLNGFSVRPASDVAGDFEKMVKVAGEKKLLIQEIGYPASELVNSDETKQAAFVDEAFKAISKHKAKLAGVSFFLLYDFNKELMRMLEKYYGISDKRFLAFLATLGFHKADGTPRKAWARFESGVKGLKS